MDVLSIINELKRCKENINKYNDIETNKKFRLEYKKWCYELCKLLNWNMKELMKYENDLNVYAASIKTAAKYYATEVLGISNDKLKDQIYNATIGKKNDDKEYDYLCVRYDRFFENLVKAPNLDLAFEVIDKAINNGEVSIKKSLITAIADFAVYNYPNKKNDVIVDLETKINAYKKHIGYVTYDKEKVVEARKTGKFLEKQKRIDNAIDKVKEFIDSDAKNTRNFCEKTGVSIGSFDEYLAVCKNRDIVLYRCFLDELVKRANLENESAVDLIKKTSFFIETGIENNDGTMRKFDVIDFYLLSKMDWSDFSKILVSGAGILPLALSNHKQRKLREFFMRNDFRFRTNLFNIQDVLENKIKIGSFSNEGEVISYYQIPLEEKKAIINYLINNNIPLNQLNYFNALERYLSGNLSIGCEIKNNVLTRRLKKD